MKHNEILQTVLDYIDDNISEELTVSMIAKKLGYSVYHFSRLFSSAVGIAPMAYVTWRKLQFAIYDIAQGKRIIDVAMEYGFETHGGFTKAFRRCFGFPPSLCYTRINAKPPTKMSVEMLKNKFLGGNEMNPHIIELTPFSVVGYPSRHKKPNVKTTADAPTFWNTIELDYSTILTKLYDAFPRSKHFEISMCYEVDESTGEFTYMLGRGIDNPTDFEGLQPDMTRLDIAGGLYAIFSTVPADSYIQNAQETWNEIFMKWLPQSEFELDETRYDFEYHDKRDHGYYFGGKLQIDICIPIRQKDETRRKSQSQYK